MPVSKQSIYDEEYFERGSISGKSCYLNYQWLPELTIRMVHHIAKKLKFKSKDRILDFGCAKGFMVKAFRILDYECYGCDISEYAIQKAEGDVKNFCILNSAKNLIPFKNIKFDWLIVKDVLGHMTESEVEKFMSVALNYAQKMFLVVPLGKNDNYIAPEYGKDISHILAKDREWWIRKIEKNHWKIKKFYYKFSGVKENWTSKYPKSNGFFVLERKKI